MCRIDLRWYSKEGPFRLTIYQEPPSVMSWGMFVALSDYHSKRALDEYRKYILQTILLLNSHSKDNENASIHNWDAEKIVDDIIYIEEILTKV